MIFYEMREFSFSFDKSFDHLKEIWQEWRPTNKNVTLDGDFLT